MTRSSDITSVTDLRSNFRGQIDRARDTGRPIFITTNGHTEAVLLSPEAFDALMDKAELVDSLAAIERGLADAKAGRTRSLREALHEIAAELSLDLGR
jgi:prevent-host-death family protein